MIDANQVLSYQHHIKYISIVANRATRFNRKMTMASAVFAIILLGCVFGMLYFAFQNVKEKDRVINNLYSLRFDQGFTDSLTIAVNDSVVFEGIASDTIFMGVDGYNRQNMISIEDHTDGQTLNADLPLEPSAIIVAKKEKLSIETIKIMAPTK